MQRIVEFNEKYEKTIKSKTLYGITIGLYKVSQLDTFRDSDEILKIALNLIRDILDYFEDNELIEFLLDPLIVASSLYLQGENPDLKKSVEYIKMAEKIVD